MSRLHQLLRPALRREKLPAAVLAVLAADGTLTWLRAVARALREQLGDRRRARELLTEAITPLFERRYGVLRGQLPSLPVRASEPRAIALVMSSLYRVPSFRKARWMLDGVGGAAQGPRDQLRAWQLTRSLSWTQRWHELATHLGELLIVLTQELPRLGIDNSSSLLGSLCLDAGRRYARTMQKAFGLPDGPASAIEVLRVGEYIFRVNVQHHSGSDEAAGTGFIVGDACPWYVRPGWGGIHCGIFGQFQNGISQQFGCNYRLTKTIPRHGGNVCRVDLRPIKPIKLRRRRRA